MARWLLVDRRFKYRIGCQKGDKVKRIRAQAGSIKVGRTLLSNGGPARHNERVSGGVDMSSVVGPAKTEPGTITLIWGCMFSGKTSALLRRLGSHGGQRCLALKHADNGRYRQDAIVSHAGRAYPALRVRAAGEILGRLRPETTLVAVDDAHFFGTELAGDISRLAGRGLFVTITALDVDSWGRPFPAVEQLASLAHKCVRLHGTCARCGRRGDRTQRLTPIRNGNLVGGSGDYEPRCAACWRPPPESPPD